MFGRDLSIAHVDIDHFRSINERHGTPVGDRVLRSCAQALQSCVRGSDLVARYSGEEFIVCCLAPIRRSHARWRSVC